MASKGKKTKIVTKDDLRRLMREKQAVNKSSSKKIDHPLAKYNSLDQLVCVLCNCNVKSGLLWPAHIQSRSHKDKLARPPEEPPGSKRKHSDAADSVVLKKHKDASALNNKTGVPADFFDNGKAPKSVKQNSIAARSTTQPNSTAPRSILAHYSSSDESDAEDERPPTSAGRTNATIKPYTSSELPPDFFDTGVMPSASTSKPEEEEKPNAMADVLPEGFFDDPVKDAKVREVEYVDKMEHEWELFQKSMKEEAHVSEAIIEEEDEEVNVNRNLDEIDQQIQCWKELNDLENKKEEIMKDGPKLSSRHDDNDDDLSEDKLDEFLDWRSKKTWR